MAKAGEGDERWIVDDMGSQGTNVSSVWPDMQIISCRSSQIRLMASMPHTHLAHIKRVYTIQCALQVNSWHWQEKDVLPWARQRLQELLRMSISAAFYIVMSDIEIALTEYTNPEHRYFHRHCRVFERERRQFWLHNQHRQQCQRDWRRHHQQPQEEADTLI